MSDQDDQNQLSDYSDSAQAFRQPAIVKRRLSSHSESSYYGGNDQEGYNARKRFRASSSQSEVNDSLELSSQSESEDAANIGEGSKRVRHSSVLSNSSSDEQPAPKRSIGHKMLVST